ncbi:MAG: helix-turn-helix transcriptional regulator [Phycisphaeraceae bacterium]
MSSPSLASLTPREREILAMIAEGDSLPSIAQRLHRSLKTIESHRLSIGRKLNASNRVELARIAIAQGLVSIKPERHAGEPAPSAQNAEQELRWLGDISEAVCNVTGRRYIDALCRAFTRVLGLRFCAVCLSAPEPATSDRYMVAMSEQGRSLEPFEYRVAQTPVPSVIEQGVCRVHDHLAEQYAEEPFFREHGVQSYLGIQLKGDFDGATGVLSVMHDRPLTNAQTIERIMRFFLARTTAELERVHRLKELQRLRQQLARHDAEAHAVAGEQANRAEGLDELDPLLAHATGIRLLNGVADVLCRLFDARFCGVCVQQTIDGEPVFLPLAYSDRSARLDLGHYPIAGTPCEKASQAGFFSVASGVADRFPDDAWLERYCIQSYFGIRLTGADGEPLGVMWLVGEGPQRDAQWIERTLKYLAPRVSMEVQTLMELEQLREHVERFEG